MIIYSKVTSQPGVEPVILSEAKAHLRVDGTEDDAYINTLIAVTRRLCESYTNRSFITQTRTVTLDRFPFCTTLNPYAAIELPYGPVQTGPSGPSVAVEYLDADGALQTLELDTDYYVDVQGDIARVRYVNGWPTTRNSYGAVTVTYTAGYGSDDQDVPEEIKQAMLMQIANLYENRQDEADGVVTKLGFNSTVLLDTVKVYGNANAY